MARACALPSYRRNQPVGRRGDQSHSAEKAAEFIENLSGTPGSELVGFTVENSNIGILRFEVSAASPLQKGKSCSFGSRARMYFIKSLMRKPPRKVSTKTPEAPTSSTRFSSAAIRPRMGFTSVRLAIDDDTPVFLAESPRDFPRHSWKPGEFVIARSSPQISGRPPFVDDLVQFHTAVLGVTGTGKPSWRSI